MKPDKVRFYNDHISFSYFVGWRGWLIKLLHRLIYWLHLQLEWRVMLYLSKSLEPEVVTALKVRWMEEKQQLGLGRRASTVATLLSPKGSEGPRYVDRRGLDGRVPTSLNNLVASQTMPRYSSSRTYSLLGVDDIDCEEVPK